MTAEPSRRTVGRRMQLAARRVAVTVVGGVVLAAGLVMLVTPGPGLLGIVAGLAILAREYTWAGRAYRWARDRWRSTVETTKGRVALRRAERTAQDVDRDRG
ncbi:PGPGW domain-containing protein [Euzebya rosea]|uniref:PGPGW domain-containing protein n=1 Tax=Euzebya rosea TaxID=2052804 RepID=UPI00196B63F5|nr:PGPGW domain-containing protein [Euzebya rosea]